MYRQRGAQSVYVADCNAPCAVKRAGIVDGILGKSLHPPIKCDSGAILAPGWEVEATPWFNRQGQAHIVSTALCSTK
jgi:hypothetical protein